MADSKLQTLVERIKARMALIQVSNGYETDLGDNVEEWLTHLQQEDVPESGLISVCDLVAEADSRDARSNPRETGWRTPIQIRFWFPRDMLTAENVRKGIQDINRAIRQDDRWKDEDGVGLVITSMPLRQGPLIPEDSFEMTGGVVEFEVWEIRQKFNSEE